MNVTSFLLGLTRRDTCSDGLNHTPPSATMFWVDPS